MGARHGQGSLQLRLTLGGATDDIGGGGGWSAAAPWVWIGLDQIGGGEEKAAQAWKNVVEPADGWVHPTTDGVPTTTRQVGICLRYLYIPKVR